MADEEFLPGHYIQMLASDGSRVLGTVVEVYPDRRAHIEVEQTAFTAVVDVVVPLDRIWIADVVRKLRELKARADSPRCTIVSRAGATRDVELLELYETQKLVEFQTVGLDDRFMMDIRDLRDVV